VGPRWALWVTGGAGAACSAGWFAAQHLEMERGAFWLWLASLLSIAVGFALAAPGGGERRQRAEWGEIALVGAVLLIALALRLPGLEGLPVEVHGDEAWCGLEARSIFRGEVRNLFGVGWYNLPYLGFALYAPFFWLFGDDLYGLRMASVFHGTLSVLLLHLVARELFRPSVGLVAAFLLAVSQWHIHFSRTGIDYIQASSVGLALFWFLLLGIRRRRPLYFLLAGYTAALCFDVYYAARLTPVLAAVYLLHRAVCERGFWRAQASHLVIMALGATLFALPMLFFFVQFPATLMARTEGVWVFAAENRQHVVQAHQVASFAAAMRRQVLRSVGAFNYFGETSLQHGRRAPLLDFWTGAFFVLGVGAFGWRLRRSNTFLVALWFWSTLLLGGVFTVDAVFSPRLSGVLPVLFLFPALFLAAGGDGLRRAFGRAGTILALATGAVFAVLCAGDNVHEYFTVHPTQQTASFYPTLARHVAAVNDAYQVYLFGDADDSLLFSTPLFLVPHIDGADVGPGMLDLPLRWIPATKGVEFLMAAGAPRAEKRLELMREAYPNGVRSAIRNQAGFVHLYAYRVEHADLLAANPGAQLRVEPITGAAAALTLPPPPPVPGGVPPPPSAAAADPSSADWEVAPAQAETREPFALPSLREPVDVAVAPNGDVFVLDRGTRRVHCFAAEGRHRFTVRARSGAEGWPDPRAIAVGADGSLLVLDARLNSVYRFSPQGRFESVRVVAAAYSPSGLARAADGAILIADTGASRIVRWPQLDGDAVEQSPGPPNDRSPVAQPAAVAAADKRVFVTDAERQALVVLDHDLREVASWPLPPFDPVHAAHVLATPTAVLVSFPEAGFIAVFDAAGTRIGTLGQGRLTRPVGMALSAAGELLVADPGASALLRVKIE
jgi:streptogramin lyase/4-amino-4-deoxy-L-arabinose transferase-like glycosyltransferase